MLHWFKHALAKAAGHQTIESAYERLGLVPQKVSVRVLGVNGLIRTPPAFVKQVVFLVIQQVIRQRAMRINRVQTNKVDGAGINIRWIPDIHKPSRRIRI